MMKKTMIFMFVICSFQLVSAHALWIETITNGTKNTKQEVKIFYGEYASKEFEPVDKWYSDVKDFKIFLTSPSNKKIELTKVTHKDHFLTDFTPTEEGTYVLTVYHPSKDVSGTSHYTFSSIAKVNINKKSNTVVENKFFVDVLSKEVKKGDDVAVVVQKKGAPLADVEVIVMSSEGWSKTFKTNHEGAIKFKALWSGDYVIEASHSDPTPTARDGKSISNSWEGTTTFLTVK